MAIPNLLELLVQGRSLALRYSEQLHPSLPSAQRFAVWVDGARIGAVAPARLSAEGTTIVLTLAEPVAAGTVVRTSARTVITYAGSVRPGVCAMANGTAVVGGFWVVPAGAQVGADQEWVQSLFPAQAGRSSTGSVVARTVRGQDTYLFMRHAQVVGFETISTPAGGFDTVVIEWVSAGTGNNVSRIRNRRWLDTITGALVRSERRVIAGLGDEHAWQAVAVSGGQPK